MSTAALGGCSGCGDDNGEGNRKQNGFFMRKKCDSDSSSTNGVASGSSDSDNSVDQEVQSKQQGGSALDCLAELENSLPMKKGISRHYYGKSKSFQALTNLNMETVADVAKEEHLTNKKRRLMISHKYPCNPNKKLSKVGSKCSMALPFSSAANTKDVDEENNDPSTDENDDGNHY